MKRAIIGSEEGMTQREKVLALKGRLTYLLRHPKDGYRLHATEDTELSWAYPDAAIDAGEVFCALGQCTPRQQRIPQRWLGRARDGVPLTQAAVAATEGVSTLTIKREASAAFRTMIAIIWDE